MTLLSVLLTLILQDQSKPTPSDQTPKERANIVLALSGGVELTYDDNILDLSNAEIRELKNRTNPTKYRITTEDDFIISPSADVGVSLALGGGERNTLLGLFVRGNLFTTNSIKNYAEIEAYGRQRFGDDSLRLAVNAIPDAYSRELLNPGTGAFASATYGKIEASLRYTHVLSKSFELSLRGMYGRKTYESPFSFRSIDIYGGSVRGTVNFSDPFALVLEGEIVYSGANPKPGQPDVSNLMGRGSATLVTRWLDRALEISVRVRITETTFTTGGSILTDPGFANRLDEMAELRVRVVYTLNDHWEAFLQYEYSTNTSDAIVGPTTEATDYTRHAVSFGFTFFY